MDFSPVIAKLNFQNITMVKINSYFYSARIH